MSRLAASNHCLRFSRAKPRVSQISSSGAMIRLLAMSPNHQVTQMARYWRQRAEPPRHKLVTPTAGLTIVLTTPAKSTNRKNVPVRSKALRPPAKRQTSQAPISASQVLPPAMPRDVTTDACVVTFTKKAPRNTPGQSRYPQTSNAASATPVGGQTADAFR